MDPRPFDERCAIWRASELFGDKCTLLILRDLFQDGERTFSDFRAEERGFSPSTLSKRLKALTAAGYLEIKQYEEHPPRFLYRLTKNGRRLGPVMQAMYTWGGQND